MAKKKHQPKKHTFKHAAPVAAPLTSNASAAPTAAANVSSRPITASSTRDFSYVNHDLRRVMIFAAGLITLELALWLAMDYTALGNVVYGLIKL